MWRFLKEKCTDPTYKEWKPLVIVFFFGIKVIRRHGSYLQGMETFLLLVGLMQKALPCTDPTYKEWKPTLLSFS